MIFLVYLDEAHSSRDEPETYTQLKSRSGSLQDHDQGSNTRSFIIVGVIFIASLVGLGLVYVNFPNLDE